MLKFKHIMNTQTGEVWVSSDMKELICNCNDETDIFLSYIDFNDNEIIIDEPIKNLRFDGIKHENHRGTWYSFDCLYNSEDGLMLLCEHETYGDETACIIINLDGELILDEVWNGWEDYDEMLICQELEEKYNKRCRMACLTKQDLEFLRKEIVLNSLFYKDYKNVLGIEEQIVCNFFDGYVDYLKELMEEDIEYKNEMDFHNIIERYDNIENLWNYYNTVEWEGGEE